MALQADSGDSEILKHTTKDEEGRFTLTLPDGEVLKGGAAAKDFQAITGWCEGVRNHLAHKAESKRAKARRGDLPPPEPAAPAEPETEDALGYAQNQVDIWSKKLHRLRDQAVELQAKLEEANANYTKWEKILKSLEENDE